jgi:glycerol-3-phosphate dehydrogenase (NAD(P)+)
MSRIGILGAGAFGTALALVLLGAGREVVLWGRDTVQARRERRSPRLPGVALPPALDLAEGLDDALTDTLLLAVPMQALAGFLADHAAVLDGRVLVACCKGIDLGSGLGPVGLIRRACPNAIPALISGPGFATDLAAGLPTALTLAVPGDEGPALQVLLSGANLRLYLSTDLAGVEAGGALKNVVAIACGIVIGAGLGESARAALLTRGYAEMVRYAVHFGASERTLAGLSGLGDLVLTASSPQSRNYSHGLAIGAGRTPPAGVTVEGVATCRALVAKARAEGLDLPVAEVLARVLDGGISVAEAVRDLLARPLKAE